MSQSSRHRLPSRVALVSIVLRVLTIALATLSLVLLVYMSTALKRHFAGGYAAALATMLLDTAEVTALSDRRRLVPQLPPTALLCAELLAVGLCAWAAIQLALADLAEHTSYGAPYPADPWRVCVLWFGVAAGALHAAYMCLVCIEACRVPPQGPGPGPGPRGALPQPLYRRRRRRGSSAGEDGLVGSAMVERPSGVHAAERSPV